MLITKGSLKPKSLCLRLFVLTVLAAIFLVSSRLKLMGNTDWSEHSELHLLLIFPIRQKQNDKCGALSGNSSMTLN